MSSLAVVSVQMGIWWEPVFIVISYIFPQELKYCNCEGELCNKNWEEAGGTQQPPDTTTQHSQGLQVTHLLNNNSKKINTEVKVVSFLISLLPSSAQAPAKPSWAEVSIIFRFGRPAGRPTIHPEKYHPDELGSWNFACNLNLTLLAQNWGEERTS